MLYERCSFVLRIYERIWFYSVMIYKWGLDLGWGWSKTPASPPYTFLPEVVSRVTMKIIISHCIYHSKCLINGNYRYIIKKLERHLDNEMFILIKYVIFIFKMSYKTRNFYQLKKLNMCLLILYFWNLQLTVYITQ
jgi:hypothetical protein